MKTEYWNLCYKPENCAEHCPRCEKHWYSMHGYIFSSQYICQLSALEKCPFDQPEFEKTEAPAQLKSDLEYDEAEIIYKNAEAMLEKAGVRLISPVCGDCKYFANDGLLQCPCDKHNQYVYRRALGCQDFEAVRGKRIKGNFIEDGNTSAICYWCDFFNSEKKKCKKHHPLPEVNQTCPYIQSTGANR